MPGPYAIAHLKTALEANAEGAEEVSPRILLTDTLEHPAGQSAQIALDPLQNPVAFEGAIADRIKAGPPPSVIIGNPPYRRLRRDDGGGWVVHGPADTSEALFDDILAAANEHTIFSHVASLYNLYVYFWRWALWNAFERRPDAPAVVSFITGSSWLHGPAFIGLRELAVRLADEIWITDLGGDAHGGVSEDNVFDIQTPVAIVTLIRYRGSAETAALRYRRFHGSTEEKLWALGDPKEPLSEVEWISLDPQSDFSFLPRAEESDWDRWPLMADLFPWQQPGPMLNRTWPVAPDAGTLAARWDAFLADPDPVTRSRLFPDPKTGRMVTTQVGALPRLADIPPGTPHEPVVRYLWRALDRHYSLDDIRLSAGPRPSLWQSLGPSQVFAVTDHGKLKGIGPQILATTVVPDKHAFCGRGGKDIFPLYRDGAGMEQNITPGLVGALAPQIGMPTLGAESILAYTFCLLSTPMFSELFLEEHRDEDLRVPLTSDTALFGRAAAIGAELIWLQTFAERMRDLDAGRGPSIPRLESLVWRTPVTQLPAHPADIVYDPETRVVSIGTAQLAGVRPAVWGYQFNGWPVLQRWLEHRTERGRGKRTSELNEIRPERWCPEWTDELLDLVTILDRCVQLQPAMDEILEDILAGPQVNATSLPLPSKDDRKPPATRAPSASGGTLF
jgi:hypothetical protein